MADLENYIIENLLNPDTASVFFLDAIKFDSEKLRKACTDIIVS